MDINKLNQLLDKQENETLEFKTRIDDNIYKIIVAFANTAGGTLIIGFNENKDIIGVSSNEVDLFKASLKNFELEAISKLEEINYKNKCVVVVSVSKSNKLLYFKGISYKRVNDINVRLSSDEITSYYKSLNNGENQNELFDAVKELSQSLIDLNDKYDKDQKKNFWISLFFCILSAILGVFLGKIL